MHVRRERRDRRRHPGRRRADHAGRRADRARDRDRRLGRRRGRRRTATRRSCSRRSTSRRTRSPRRSPTAPCAATASTSTSARRSRTTSCAASTASSIVACGTSYHAGLIGRYAIEEWARVPVEMDVASEYRYRNPVVGPGDLVIGITQSGETADTLAAMRLARERGATVLAVTNIMGSQATRDADGVLYTRAGLEIGVAATKTFIAQVAAMYLLALRLAELRGDAGRGASAARIVADLKHIPHHIADVLERHDDADRARRRAPLSGRVLPLPRPPRRAAGRARGRAQAQGDLLHRHRRLRGRRDEARADRAARRGDAGRRRRHRLARARQGRLQHAGGPRPRRARDRRRHRGRPDDRRARRGGPARARGRTGSCSRCWRSSRCRCWPTGSPASAASTSTSRATSPRPSPSSSVADERRRHRPAGDRAHGEGARATAEPGGAAVHRGRARVRGGRGRPAQHLAARFCAKEAVAKALALQAGTRSTSRSWRAATEVQLHGHVAQRAESSA